MNKVAALCGPAVLAELESICDAVLNVLLANPAEFECPDKWEALRNRSNATSPSSGVEDRLDNRQIKRAVVRSFRKGWSGLTNAAASRARVLT
jgi:hypothetical protein